MAIDREIIQTLDDATHHIDKIDKDIVKLLLSLKLVVFNLQIEAKHISGATGIEPIAKEVNRIIGDIEGLVHGVDISRDTIYSVIKQLQEAIEDA